MNKNSGLHFDSLLIEIQAAGLYLRLMIVFCFIYKDNAFIFHKDILSLQKFLTL